MAVLYGKAAGGNFNGANWSTTGSLGVDSVTPTAADDCILETGSGNFTINSGSVCRSLDCTSGTGSYGGTLTHSSAVTFTIGDATAGAGNVAFKLAAGMTYTLNAAASSALAFVSTSGTQQAITFAGKTTGTVTFNGAGGNWQYQDNHTATGSFNLTEGTLDMNGRTCSYTSFNSNNANTRTLTLGAAAITNAGTLAFNVVTGLTITANTAVITCTNNNLSITAGTINWNGTSVVITGGGTTACGAAPIFNNVTITGTASKTDVVTFSNSNGWTMTGTFTATGNSSVNRILIQSTVVGTARPITAAAVSLTNVDFMDMTGAGAASWTGTSLGDCGGNTNITFTSPLTLYRVGAGGNWSASNWSLTSGGTTDQRVPLPQDTVNVDANASGTVSNDMPRLGKDTNFTGFGGTWQFNVTANSIFGSLVISSGLTFSGNQQFTMAGRSTHTITSNGVTFISSPVAIQSPGGTYTLQDAFSCSAAFIVTDGTFTDSGFSVTCSTFSIATRTATLNATGTWSLTSTAATNIWNANTTTTTINAGSSTISITTTSANLRTFIGGNNKTYGILNYTLSGSTGGLDITGQSTYSAINFSDASNARTLRFTAGNTTTFTGAGLVGNGASGRLLVLSSITAATHTLSKGPSIMSVDWWNITNSIATGGAAWHAGANSTDGGGNTGWLFTAPPPYVPSGNALMMGV